MTPEQMDELCDRYGEGLMRMDGYDDCILGVASGYGGEPRFVYSYNRVIKRLMADGMTEEEAIEFHEFNQAGAYVGPQTPWFLEEI